jgi:hypothetical protein
MRLNKLGNSSKVTAEQKRLEKERQSLERQRVTLEKQLNQIPKTPPRKTKTPAHTTLNVDTVINSPARVAYGNRSSREKPKMLPTRELNSARIKFLVLALILATLVVMLWNAMPS